MTFGFGVNLSGVTLFDEIDREYFDRVELISMPGEKKYLYVLKTLLEFPVLLHSGFPVLLPLGLPVVLPLIFPVLFRLGFPELFSSGFPGKVSIWIPVKVFF